MRACVRPLALLVLAGCAETPTMKAFNTPPAVGITAPEDGAQFDQGVRIDFTALVSDDPTPAPDVALTWTSDRDGVLSDQVRADATGQVFFSVSTLSPGAHAITLAAVDPQGEQAVAAVEIDIVALPAEPTIALRSPIPGHVGAEGLATEFTVQVADPQQAADTLTLVFESDLDGTFCAPTPTASGRASCAAVLSPTPGDPAEAFHRLTFRVTDAEGLSAETTFAWHVAPAAAPEVDQDSDGQLASEGDCNDLDAAVYSGAAEACDGIDNDCDLSVDEGLTDTFWRDADGDNQGDAAQSTQACTRPSGYATNDWDCDDAEATAFAGGNERCDGVDNDCDGATDEGLLTTFYTDTDGDGQGDPSHTVAACTASVGLVSNRRDCDDGDRLAFEGAPERCNGKDDDCDGAIDDGALLTWYADVDGDTWGAASSATGACTQPIGHVSTAGDCDDASPVSHPGALEIVDALDNDCDGVADDGTNVHDDDGDGYAEQSGGAFPGGDCDDADPARGPEAIEIFDTVDQDCDGVTDEGTEGYDDDDDGLSEQQGDCDDADPARYPGAAYLEAELCAVDLDGDGWAPAVHGGGDCDDDPVDGATTYPGAPETCRDDADSDCDGTQNDEDADGASDYYFDADGDDYGVGAARWLCEEDAASGFTGWYPGDCYDANANAWPYQWQYFTVHRGDGSFDYNCDNTVTRRWTAQAGCSLSVGDFYVPAGEEGWTSTTVPSCGATGNWSEGEAGCEWWYARVATRTEAQACR